MGKTNRKDVASCQVSGYNNGMKKKKNMKFEWIIFSCMVVVTNVHGTYDTTRAVGHLLDEFAVPVYMRV